MKKPPEPPELGPAFADSGSPKPKPSPSPAYAEPDVELDDHDLSTWAYTPGGTIEQVVHTRISNANRDAYRKSMSSQDEPEYEDHYRKLMSDEFEKSANAIAQEQDAREAEDEHESDLDLTPAELKARIDQQLAEMPPRNGADGPERGPVGPPR